MIGAFSQRRVPFLPAALALVLVYGVIQVRWGETLPVREGFGWDGRDYGRIAQDLPRAVLEEGLTSYRLRRLLPSAVVYLGLSALSLPRERPLVRDAFEVLNLLLLVVTLLGWSGIAREVKLTERGTWLGFCLLLLNFANLRMPFYYPVMTDTFALAIGTLFLYAFLRSSARAMLALLVLGPFTWPSFLPAGALLYALPRDPLAPDRPPRFGLNGLSGALVALLFLVVLRVPDSEYVDQRWLGLSLALCAAYLVAVGRGLFDQAALFDLRAYRSVSPRRLVAVCAIAVVVQAVVHSLSRGTGLTMDVLRDNLGFCAAAKPGVFLVAHAVYFGPVALLVALNWRAFRRLVHLFGIGFTLYVAFHLALAVQSESRWLIGGLPAFALLGALLGDAAGWPRWVAWSIAAMGLVTSKAWLPLNQGPFGAVSEFPAQFYFMNHGPWMSYPMLLLQGALACLCALLLSRIARVPPTAIAFPGPLRPERASSATRPRVAPANLALGAFSCLACALVVEGAARLLVQRVPSGLRPPRLGQGAKARASPAEPSRVLLLGDSFVAASGAERSMRDLVAGLLDARGCGPSGVTAIAGRGYDTAEEYLAFLERAARPRSVVLFFGFDDLHSNVTPTAGRPHLALDGERLVLRPARPFGSAASPAVRRWHGSVALRLLSDGLATAHPGIHRRLAAIGLAAPLDRPPPPIEPYGPRNEAVRQMWRTTEAILKTLKQEVEARNSRLVIFYVPARFEIDLAAWDLAFKHYRMGRRHWRPDRVFNTLRSAGARLGVPIVDPRQSLKQAESPETPTYREDGLWTERGRAVAAEALAPILTVHACSESAGSKDHLSRR